MNYEDLHQTAFGVPVAPAPSWVRFPFKRNSPEGDRLNNAIARIASEVCFRQFFKTLAADGVEGSIVEFGVAGGNMLREFMDYADESLKFSRSGRPRAVWGFDSFEGLPTPDPEKDLGCWKKGDYAHSAGAALQHLTSRCYHGQIHLRSGWFKETLPKTQVDLPIAFAHVDCDLYQSAAECLDFLTGRLAHGAYLCFDDWTDDPQKGETRAFAEWFERVKDHYQFEYVSRMCWGHMNLRVWEKAETR